MFWDWRRTALSFVALAMTAVTQAAEPAKQAGKTADGQASQAKAEEQFLRLVRDDQDMLQSMETAVVSYAPQDCGKTSPSVDLIAAVHIADQGYFDQLNRLFDTYDVVLYELVAPKGARVVKGGGGNHPVSLLQKGMTSTLELAYQLDIIDYGKKNFVHADLTPDQLAAAMKEQDESPWTMIIRMMGYGMAQQGQAGASQAQMIAALFSKDRSLGLKRAMAEQFRNLDGSASAIDQVTGSIIISRRNKAAIEELGKVLKDGKKKVAIFYGAAHMPDFQTRLKEDFDLVPISTKWLVAWDMKEKAAKKGR